MPMVATVVGPVAQNAAPSEPTKIWSVDPGLNQ
jgi:hypothetical protein